LDPSATITIVRRNWEIVSSFSIGRKCTEDYELDWDTAAKVAFAIEDKGGLRITGQGMTLGEPAWRACGACSDIDGSKVAEFSGLHAELESGSFDFDKKPHIYLLAKASYTTGSATLKGCTNGEGLTVSRLVDAKSGFLFYDEPVGLVPAPGDSSLSEGQQVKYLDLDTYGVVHYFYFRSVDVP
jgi:hypothetical protein